jgi:hypothetical protein
VLRAKLLARFPALVSLQNALQSWASLLAYNSRSFFRCRALMAGQKKTKKELATAILL